MIWLLRNLSKCIMPVTHRPIASRLSAATAIPHGFDYLSYGLHIRSALPLPELAVDSSGAPRDVYIELSNSIAAAVDLPVNEEVVWRSATEAQFHYYDAGSF